MNDSSHPFTLKLTCDRSYLVGFPLIVGVEVRNVSANHFELLPFFDLFTVPGPVSFILRGGGHEWTWNEMSRRTDGEPQGFEFEPGTAWLALQDLSELHPDIPAGHYELFATILFPGRLVHAAPVQVEVQSSTKKDRDIASRLRATNDRGESRWHTFIRHNWSTPDTHGLSDAARARLAFYLYLHRVAYGPQSVASLNPDEPWQFGHGVLESEAALMRLEILHAAGRPEAAGVEPAILERWPGLAWSVEQVHQHNGLLTRLRTYDGVDSSYAPKDKPRPYQKAK